MSDCSCCIYKAFVVAVFRSVDVVAVSRSMGDWIDVPILAGSQKDIRSLTFLSVGH